MIRLLRPDRCARTRRARRGLAPSFGLLLALGCDSGDPRDVSLVPPPETPEASPATEVAPALAADVWGVFDRRCVVCHACYDAPCQLTLVSHQGAERGASREAVYRPQRLTPQQLTRLGIDAHGVPAWRKLGFHDVIRGRAGVSDGLLLEMLALGRQADFEPAAPLPEGFPLDIKRELACPSSTEFAEYARRSPQGGMPYGLPPLEDDELTLIHEWLGAGAPAPPVEPPDRGILQQVADWERFLNGPSLEERIVSRYLYEHWFVTHLYFPSHPTGPFFRPVRSSTPPGQEIREIATRRPYDAPGAEPFWYRLAPIRETIVHKTHIVYPLGPERMERLRALFLAGDWKATKFPRYGHELASNPFATYEEVPARARYQFLLDDAHHFVMTFIRGPVCHGQVAVDVIEDHFWVGFLDPDYDLSVTDPGYLEAAKKLLDLPAEEGSMALPGAGIWADHAANQVRYLNLRRARYAAIDPEKKGPPLEAIWDGDGHDRDALLTVWRHFDNAAVERGLIGTVPETAWIMDFPIFERIYYDLVAGFDVFGNVAHQVATRLYMDHLRMQSENLLLAFLPEAARQPLRDSWYLDADNEIHKRFINRPVSAGHGTQVPFQTDDYIRELFALVRARMPGVGGLEDALNRCGAPPCEPDAASALERGADAELRQLPGRRGPWVRHLPEVSWIRVHEDGRPARGSVYSLLHDRAHTNVASMFGEEERLQPELDQVTVVSGTLGSYPNFFFDVALGELGAFREALVDVADPAGYERLVERFGVRRTDPRFWPLLDWIHADFARRAPTRAGIIDLGRYENR